MTADIFELASHANAAAQHYRDTVARNGYSDTVAVANALLAATDALTTAICDAIA